MLTLCLMSCNEWNDSSVNLPQGDLMLCPACEKFRFPGRSHLLRIILSVICGKIGVTEIGQPAGCGTLGTGVNMAVRQTSQFHIELTQDCTYLYKCRTNATVCHMSLRHVTCVIS